DRRDHRIVAGRHSSAGLRGAAATARGPRTERRDAPHRPRTVRGEPALAVHLSIRGAAAAAADARRGSRGIRPLHGRPPPRAAGVLPPSPAAVKASAVIRAPLMLLALAAAIMPREARAQAPSVAGASSDTLHLAPLLRAALGDDPRRRQLEL